MARKNFSRRRNALKPDAHWDTQRIVLPCVRNLVRFKSAIPGSLLGLLALLFCFGLYISCSQKPAYGLDPGRTISQYGHTNWRVEDGTFKAGVADVVQTADGYIWIATRNGLVRFDGVRFVSWETVTGDKMPIHEVYALHAARDGSLWIAYWKNIVRWKNGTITRYTQIPPSPQRISETPDGRIWVGFTRFDPKRPTMLCSIQAETVRCYGKGEGVDLLYVPNIVPAGPDQLWLGNQNGLIRWNTNTHNAQQIEIPSSHLDRFKMSLNDLLLDFDQTLWAAYDDGEMKFGLQHYVSGTWHPIKMGGFDSSKLQVQTLFRDTSGNLWIGTVDDGVFRITANSVDHYRAADGLSGDLVRRFLEDREGNLWVATSKGLDKFRDLPVATFTKVQGLSSENAASVAAAPDGTIAIGNLRQIDRILPRSPWTIATLSPPPDSQIESLMYDHKGRLWAEVGQHLTIFDGHSAKLVRSVTGQLPGYVKQMRTDHSGDVWALSYGALGKPRVLSSAASDIPYFLHIRNDVIVDAIQIDVATGGPVRLFAIGPNDEMWFCLADGSLSIWRNGQFVRLFRDKPFHNPSRLWVLRDGTALVLAHDLIAVVSGNRRSLNSQSGFTCESVYEVHESRDGDLWFYTDCGIVQVTSTDFHAWLTHPGASIHPRILDRFDGAFPALPTFSPASAESPDGKVWFVNDDILQMIDPHHLMHNDKPPPVHIEALTADGANYPLKGDLQLRPGTRTLQIDYTALSFSVPGKVRFRYLLEGWDKTWQDAGDRRQALYSNLPPRQYAFRVIACNNDGVWNQEGDTIRFRISPMFWQTGAFKAIAVVGGFAVLWLLIKYRMTLIYARIRDRWAARVAERERIARELHDSFLQGIQGLLLRFNTVARSMPPESPTRKSMEEALGLSNEIMLTGRRLLQDLRDTSRAATLSEELEAIGRGFQGLYATEFSMSSLGKERPIDPFVTDELFKVGREAISNAFRHAQARSILVALEFRDRDLKLSIRDNGVGIEERLLIEGKKVGHWGLPGMRERVAQLHGNIRFESRHGIGTTVEVKIPAHRAYRRRQVRLSRCLSLIGDNDRYLE